MNKQYFHPGFRILFLISFLSFIAVFVTRKIDVPEFVPILFYVLAYAGVILSLIQVLLSKTLKSGEKTMWIISLLFLSPIALLIYTNVYKRIHRFYIQPSKIYSH